MTLTVCICTKDRPAILNRCLDSIFAGTVPPAVVLVSDDSKDTSQNERICSCFPLVVFLKGPRRGLCANRNSVVQYADTDYLSLLDDDAILAKDFVAKVIALLPTLDKRTIVTGDLIEVDRRSGPRNSSFLGFFTEQPIKRNETIHLNCNVFPRKAFEDAEFDEEIAYGYEDMDLCSHLLSLGYSIQHDPTLVNLHLAPMLSSHASKERELQAERARFYTSIKRYFLWDRNWIKGFAYLLLAPLHRTAHAVNRRDFRDILHCVGDIVFAVQRLIVNANTGTTRAAAHVQG
jgi:GT2 family glycosyltransferase